MKYALVICSLALAGCGGASIGLNPPAEALMKAPEPAADLPKGADMKAMYESYIKLRRQYGRVSDRTRGLQAYAKLVSKK